MNSAANTLANFASLFPALQEFINLLTIAIGLFVAAYGVYAIVYSGHAGSRVSRGGGVASVFVGTIMASMTYFMGRATNQFFHGASPRSALSYSAPGSTDAASTIVEFTLYLAALFGWYWALKGCYLIHRGSHPQKAQQDDARRGFTRLGAALAATNLLFITNLIAAQGGFNNPLAL